MRLLSPISYRFAVKASLLVMAAMPSTWALAQSAPPTPPASAPAPQTPAPQTPAAQTPAQASAPADYVLGPEDVITVLVQRHPEFSGDFPIPTSGIVDLPAVGSLNMNGLTVAQVKDFVESRLKTRLRSPEVSVFLKMPRMKRVYLFGDVKAPSAYDYKPGWRLVESLSAAGGLNLGLQPQDVTVTVLRSNGERLTIPLSDALTGDPDKDVIIQPGDVVTVQSIEMFPVYVTGQVKLPGLVRLRRDNTTVMQAIAIAGGMLPEASTANVTVTHLNGQSEKINLSPSFMEGKNVPAPHLQSGDLIVVPELQSHIAVLGLVKQPNFFPLEDGRTIRITDAISMANGADSKRARLSKVGLVRIEDGKEKHYVYDVGRYLSKGDLSQNPVLKPGDVVYVPETNTPDWANLLSGLTSVGVILNAIK